MTTLVGLPESGSVPVLRKNVIVPRATEEGLTLYVHGSVHHESMSIIVQQGATIYSFIILVFLQTARHVSDGILIHHQEHIQIVIATSGIG